MAETVPGVIATSPAEAGVATTIDEGGAGEHLQPTLLGLEPYQWVAIAMATLILFAIFGAKVHRTMAGGLDRQIAAIREQLGEAKRLRAEAEELRAEYAAKIAGAEKDAEAMLDNARAEAAAIVEKAESDTAALIRRRERMAQDKIAAAERAAVDALRARAAEASTAAAARLIRERHDAEADRRLADETIAAL